MEWKSVALGNIADVQSGGTPLRSMSEYWGGNLPWYSSGELNTSYTCDPKRTITETGLTSSNAKLYPKGSLLIGMYDTAALKMSILDREAAFNQAIAGVKPNANIDLKFIMASINNSKIELLALRRGVRQKNLNLKKIKNISILLPPLTEQKRIVAILDEAFKGIDAAIANTQMNLASARELFESYLDDVFTKKSEGWDTGILKDAVASTCSLSYGIVQPGVEFHNGLPIVRPTDLKTNIINLDGLKRIDPSLATSYKRTKLLGNELLLCVRGSTGTVSIASKELEGANVTRGIVPIRFDSSIIKQEFGYYQFRSKVLQDQIKKGTYGAALMQINIRDLKNIAIRYPTINIQNVLVQSLESISTETQSLETIYQQKLKSLAELKQSMLVKAFSGELTAQPEQVLKEAFG